MTFLLKILLFVHFAWHAIAAIGVTAAIWHSYDVHKGSRWKLAFAILWLIISVVLILAPESSCH